ncbi:MAG: hypothetical protein ABIZ04_20415, partial [Opitutus sp.]
ATWLAPLEKTISVFLAKDWVGGFIRSAQLDLVANFSLDGRTLKASFDSLARADDLESIRSEIIQADSIWARREGSGLNFFPGF